MFKIASCLNKSAAKRTFIRLSESQITKIDKKLKKLHPLLPVNIVPNLDSKDPISYGSFSIKTTRRLTREQLEQILSFLTELNLDVKSIGGINAPKIQLTAISEGINNIFALKADTILSENTDDGESISSPIIFRLSVDEVSNVRKEIRDLIGVGVSVKYVNSPINLKGSFTVDWSKLKDDQVLDLKNWLTENHYITITGYPDNFFLSKNIVIDPSSDVDSSDTESTGIKTVDDVVSVSIPVTIKKSDGLEEESVVNNNLARSVSYESFIDGFNFITVLFLVTLIDSPESKNLSASGLLIANKHTRTIKASFLNILNPIVNGNPDLEALLEPLDLLSFDKGDWKKVIINVKKIIDISSENAEFTNFFPLHLREDISNLLRIFSEKKGNRKGLIGELSTIPNYRSFLGTSEWMDTVCTRLGIERSAVDRISSEALAANRLATKVSELETLANVSTGSLYDAASLSLHQEKTKLDDVLKTTPNFEAITATIANQAVNNRQNDLIKRIGFSAEQTQVILQRGSSIVAAGAGSGKTRAMAGTVAKSIESGLARPEEIIANSFTRKSSQELRERCERFLGMAKDGLKGDNLYIGRTIDSTVASLILKYGKDRYVKRMFYFTDKTDLFNSLLRAAVCQVGMFIDDTSLEYALVKFLNIVAISDSDIGFRLKDSIEEYGRTKKLNLSNATLKLLRTTINNKYSNDITSISPNIKSQISERDIERIALFIGLTDFNFSKSNSGKSYFKDMTGIQTRSEISKLASFQDSTEQESKRNLVAQEAKRSPYLYKPANQWFNIGYPYKLTIKDAASAVARLSGKFRNPEELWDKYKDFYNTYSETGEEKDNSHIPPESPCMLAVWGAYEWLKRNEPSIQKVLGNEFPLDRTDTLWAFGDLMQHNSNARSQLQSRFKVVLIDEGQDLNAAQHRFFEYIAGIRNPSTDTTWEIKDKSRPARGLTAEVYSIIGDDKQCLSATTCISTKDGYKLLSEVKTGDKILSYRNSEVVEQVVSHVCETSWTWGYKITTDTGNLLIMSPNHRIWVSSNSSNRSYKNYVNILAHTDRGTVVKYLNAMHNFDNYRDALTFATSYGQHIVEKIGFNGKFFELMMSMTVQVGMGVICIDDFGNLYEDKIVSVEKVEDSFIDLDVNDASNFFGNNVLSHNSIYSFRSADPEEFIHRSDLQSGNFKTILLSTNYRSGEQIVDAANTLISHNSSYQIPMACQATPHKGSGLVASRGFDAYSELCEYVMKEIRVLKDERQDLKWKDFGIVIRVNDESHGFELAALKYQIPYIKSKSMMSDPVLTRLINWLSLAVVDDREKLADMFYATLSFPETGLSADTLKKKVVQLTNTNSRFDRLLNEQGILRLVLSQSMPVYSKKSMESSLLAHAKMCLDIRAKAAEADISFDTLLDYMLDYKDGNPNRKTLRDALKDLDKEVKNDVNEDVQDDTVTDDSEESLEVSTDTNNPVVKKYDLPVVLSLKQILSASQKKGETEEYGINDIKTVVDYFYKLKKIAEANKNKIKAGEEDAVPIYTVHMWKGLEARHVFIVMNSTTFPDGRRLFLVGPKNNKKPIYDHPKSENIYKYNNKIREERRLAYVAITRGEETVLAVWSRKDHMNKDSGPSMFIDESCIIDLNNLQQKENTELEDVLPVDNEEKEKLEE